MATAEIMDLDDIVDVVASEITTDDIVMIGKNPAQVYTSTTNAYDQRLIHFCFLGSKELNTLITSQNSEFEMVRRSRS